MASGIKDCDHVLRVPGSVREKKMAEQNDYIGKAGSVYRKPRSSRKVVHRYDEIEAATLPDFGHNSY